MFYNLLLLSTLTICVFIWEKHLEGYYHITWRQFCLFWTLIRNSLHSLNHDDIFVWPSLPRWHASLQHFEQKAVFFFKTNLFKVTLLRNVPSPKNASVIFQLTFLSDPPSLVDTRLTKFARPFLPISRQLICEHLVNGP